MLWAPTTYHRLRALSGTMNYFDVQLAVHLPDLLTTPAFQTADLALLVVSLLSMARVTYLVLPCVDKPATQFIQEAVAKIPNRGYTLGLRGCARPPLLPACVEGVGVVVVVLHVCACVCVCVCVCACW